eukprot:TRINITY_DN32111_c0_g1_i1.p1 TRINITY_DN32111_c0_g1~~TRINITY_DN32111_c0_g1_i1.p1  ORF type:complete len:491 (+),score=150.40 TRINITY_DN32111_c0_g1_i1:58-1530(+)
MRALRSVVRSEGLRTAQRRWNAEHDRSEGDINLTPLRRKYQKEHIENHEETARLLKEDARYFLHQTLSSPCMNALEKAEGVHLQDLQGRRFLDFHGNSVHQVGFGNEEVLAAVKQQLDTLPFCPRRYTNPTAVGLARRLVELCNPDDPGFDAASPGAADRLSRVLFAPGGTSGIGVALKLARVATGRFKTISMWDSFHGASLDAISVGGEAVFRRNIGPLMPGTEHAPPPDPQNCLYGCGGDCSLRCANYVEYMLEKEQDVAAVIAEPIRWTPYVPKKEYWQRIRKACDKHGTLLIFDEIPNSLGRTGTGMFTFQHFGVTPDVLVLGKGLGGGVFPLSAVVAKEKLNEAARTHALGHYTHEKSPVAAAAALATLQYIESNKLVENARQLGGLTVELLKGLQQRHRWIRDVRGVGLLIGVEIGCPTGADKAAAADAAERMLYACLQRGLSFKVTAGCVLTLCPPLTITEDQMRSAVDIIEDSLSSLQLPGN